MPAQAPAAGLPPGHRIAEYEIVRVLGAGGFGITYLAFDHQLDGPVAIKEYFPADLAARVDGDRVAVTAPTNREIFAWGLERFLEEARAIHRFRHSNVVQAHRYLEANGTAYIVMEYVEGESLKAILDRHGRLPAEEWRPWLGALLDGLEHVHSLGYLHRDIKPANIVIRAATGEPVLIDFGSARARQRDRTHTQVFTAGYAPIEQYSGGGGQGPPSDIYSLAAVSYRVLTGEPLPSAPDRALDDSYQPLPEQVAGTDSRLWAAIDRGLALRPQDRPQSVADWRQALGSADAASANKANAAPVEAVRRRPSDGKKNTRNEPLPTPDEALDFPEKTPAHQWGPGVPPLDPSDEALDASEKTTAGARSRHLWWAVPALFTTALVILRLAAGPIGDSQAPAGPDWAAAPVPAQDDEPKHRRAAEQGDADAQYYLGVMYASGRGVPKDDEEAVRWYRRAAEQGLARAQYSLGFMYDSGRGVPKDHEQAVGWFRRAAEQGLANAQYGLGFMYASGRGVPRDQEQAARWFRRAAEQDHAQAQVNLASMYASGEGVPQDHEEAARWYRRAAEQGLADAQFLGSWFTLGSHQNDVLRIQGSPTEIQLDGRLEMWHYGGSEVTIHRATSQVRGWDNSEGNLRVQLLPGNSGTDASSFTLGSHQDDVLRLHGTPTEIQLDGFLEWWHYGGSEVTIRMSTRQVDSWRNPDSNLKVQLLPGNSGTDASSFTLGSHQDDVLRLHGTPIEMSYWDRHGVEQWYYGLSHVRISMFTRQVEGWDNSDSNLRVQLLPGNSGTDASSFTLGSHQDDVIRLQGTPTSAYSVSAPQEYSFPTPGFQDCGFRRFSRMDSHLVLGFGGSNVRILDSTRQVVGSNNSDGNLKVRPPDRRAAEQGHAQAQYELGLRYVYGEEAVRWYRLAAEQGHAQAQYELGAMYQARTWNRGGSPSPRRGVPLDDEEAARWLRRAAEQGHALAQFNLGVMYGDDRVVPQDHEEAARWFHRAAEQGEKHAQFNLGVMYACGRGVPQDDVAALMWMHLSGYNDKETLEKRMSAGQIAAAQRAAREWRDSQAPAPDKDRATAARAEAWTELEEAQATLQARRAELEQLRAQAAAPAEGEDAEALGAQADALEEEIGADADAFMQKLVNHINEAGWNPDDERDDEQRAVFAMKSSEDMYLAQEYVVKGGDYREAIEILRRAQTNDPDNPDLAAMIARYEADRYVSAERFAEVKLGMTEAEVEAVLGKVFHSYVRNFADDKVFAWFYPKDPEQHGRSAAVGVFFRENDRKVYRTDFNAVEGQDEEE